jgi:hypothetical protein
MTYETMVERLEHPELYSGDQVNAARHARATSTKWQRRMEGDEAELVRRRAYLAYVRERDEKLD